MKVKILATLMLAALALPISAFSQAAQPAPAPSLDTEIQLLREDVQAAKNELITHNMQFTTAEASAFWPVYNEYAKAQQAIGTKRVQLIKDYAASFNTMDDAKAHGLTERLLAIEQEYQRLRSDYLPRFEKALGARRAARFYQVDNRLTLLVNIQLTSEIPLVP